MSGRSPPRPLALAPCLTAGMPVSGAAPAGLLRRQVAALAREELEDRLLRLHDEALDLKRRVRDADDDLKRCLHACMRAA